MLQFVLQFLKKDIKWVGVSTADVTYLLLLFFGVLRIIKKYRLALEVVGIVGAVLLIWFAYKIIKQKVNKERKDDNDKFLLHCFTSGYLIAFLSPLNMLF